MRARAAYPPRQGRDAVNVPYSGRNGEPETALSFPGWSGARRTTEKISFGRSSPCEPPSLHELVGELVILSPRKVRSIPKDIAILKLGARDRHNLIHPVGRVGPHHLPAAHRL